MTMIILPELNQPDEVILHIDFSVGAESIHAESINDIMQSFASLYAVVGILLDSDVEAKIVLIDVSNGSLQAVFRRIKSDANADIKKMGRQPVSTALVLVGILLAIFPPNVSDTKGDKSEKPLKVELEGENCSISRDGRKVTFKCEGAGKIKYIEDAVAASEELSKDPSALHASAEFLKAVSRDQSVSSIDIRLRHSPKEPTLPLDQRAIHAILERLPHEDRRWRR